MAVKKKADAAKIQDEAKAAVPHKLTPEEIASVCAQIADDRKAMNIVKLKMAELSTIADYIVICTGTSDPHLNALAERIQRELRNNFQVRANHIDGKPGSHWMIIDFGSVMVHLMTNETRELYQLESLWGDAPRVDAVKKITSAAKKLRKQKVEADEAGA